MFKKFLLKQTGGERLKFSSESSLGFISGENYVIISIDSYMPSLTNVTLSFFEGPEAPSIDSWGIYSNSFISSVNEIHAHVGFSVDENIMISMSSSAIDHLKSFNSECSFEFKEL